MANTAKNPTKVITGPKTIFSYLNVNEPKVPMGGGTPKYSVSLIIPKSDTVTVNKIKAAIKAAYDEGQSKLKGNSKFVPVNANSTTKPGVVDADRQDIIDTSELYSGIVGRASINFYAYNSNGNKGIACGLNNLQKLADGTPLGGHSRAEDDFADLDDEDDEDFLG